MDISDKQFEEDLRALGIDVDALPEAPPGLTSSDLGQMSIAAMVRDSLGTARAMDSQGHLRLHGGAITGHRVDLSDAGQILILWQRMITVLGASLRGLGHQTRGRFPVDVINQTTLQLDAQPSPGSVVLSMTPKSRGLDEAHPEGESLLGWIDADRPLADQAVDVALDLIALAHEGEADPARLVGRLNELGPRSAAALKKWLKLVAQSSLDVDASWAEPGHKPVRVNLTARDAAHAGAVIEGRKLDGAEETLTGELVTVSVEDPLKLTVPHPVEGDEKIKIKRGELTDEQIGRFRTRRPVRMRVWVEVEELPGGDSKVTYSALSVEEI